MPRVALFPDAVREWLMMRFNGGVLGAACLLLAACATGPKASDNAMCAQIDTWGKGLSPGQTTSVELVRGGVWMVNHYKRCTHAEGDLAATRFCAWLMDNTSTEFMEYNVNRTLACLQGQRIVGYLGNTGVDAWSGTARFTRLTASEDMFRVELRYALDYSAPSEETMMQLTLTALD
jgi:hypothetical protein